MAVRSSLSGVCIADRVDEEGLALSRLVRYKPYCTHCHDFEDLNMS
jgi:hypothetical protein